MNRLHATLRPERPGDDDDAIDAVMRAAFDTPAEAELVRNLRKNDACCISLVAEVDGAVVGHILFTPVSVVGDETFAARALGPVAVLPQWQRRGIGSRLVRAGLDACRAEGHEIVFVLGHPEFYPRFGFVPTRPLGITWDRPVPDDVFMVLELRPGALRGRSGIVKYRAEFDMPRR